MKKIFLYITLFLLPFMHINAKKGSKTAQNLKMKFLKKYQQEHHEFLLQKIKNYFLNLKHIRLTFEQIHQNGQVSTGEMILHKPNKLKIQYFSPKQDKFTLNERMLLEYFDSELGETTDLPLPHVLDIILFNDFSAVKIEHISQGNNEIILQIKYEDTSVTFVMSANPIKLLRWDLLQNSQLITTTVTKIEHIK